MQHGKAPSLCMFMSIYYIYNVYVYIHNIHLVLSLSLSDSKSKYKNIGQFMVKFLGILCERSCHSAFRPCLSFSIVPFPLLKDQHPSQRARLAIAPFSWLRQGILKAKSQRCRRSGLLLELFCIQTPISPMSLACFWRARAGQGS